MRMRYISWLGAGLFAALAPHGALAAPQILAVLGTDGDIPLICADGVCQANISTYCLQRDRLTPDYGTAYVPAAAGSFTLVLRDADGGERRLPAAAHVAFAQSRSFTAISASLTEKALAGLGAVSAGLEMAADATLLPVPRAGDPDPLTPQEIAQAVGPMRSLGAQIVDADPDADAARVLAAMANRLPTLGRVDPGTRNALWRQVTERARAAAPGSAGLRRAGSAYDACVEALGDYRFVSLRGCLELGHDQLMRDLNTGYWDAFIGS